MIVRINEIDTETKEGALCIGLLALVTTEHETNKTPDEVVEMANKFIPDELIGEKCGLCEYYAGSLCMYTGIPEMSCNHICDCDGFSKV